MILPGKVIQQCKNSPKFLDLGKGDFFLVEIMEKQPCGEALLDWLLINKEELKSEGGRHLSWQR